MREYNKTAAKNLDELSAISETTKSSVLLVQNQTNQTNDSAQEIREATELLQILPIRQTFFPSMRALKRQEQVRMAAVFAVVADDP